MLPAILLFFSLSTALVPVSKSIDTKSASSTVTAASPTVTQFDTRPDGIYVVVKNDNAEPEHIKVNDIRLTTVNTTAAQQRRDVNWGGSGADVICDQSNYLWNANLWNSDNNGAYNGLATWCNYEGGPWAKWGDWTIAYAKVGQAAAYVCGYSEPPVTENHQSPCPQEELLEAFQWISVVCTMGTNGWQEAGYLTLPNWYKSYGITHPNNINSQCGSSSSNDYSTEVENVN